MTHLADIQKLTINLDALLTSCRYNRGVKFIPLLQEVDQPTDTTEYHYAFSLGDLPLLFRHSVGSVPTEVGQTASRLSILGPSVPAPYL